MSGDSQARRRKKQQQQQQEQLPPPPVAPNGSSSSARARKSKAEEEAAAGGAGWRTKLVFFFLLSTFLLVLTVRAVDYKEGQLKEAYVKHVPKEVRVYLDSGASQAAEYWSILYKSYREHYDLYMRILREKSRGIMVRDDLSLEELLFPDEVYEEEMEEKKEALEKMKKVVEVLNKQAEEKKNAAAAGDEGGAAKDQVKVVNSEEERKKQEKEMAKKIREEVERAQKEEEAKAKKLQEEQERKKKEAEEKEKQRLEAERKKKEAEEKEKQRLEAERKKKEAEEKEKQRLEAERKKKEAEEKERQRLEAERQKKEAEEKRKQEEQKKKELEEARAKAEAEKKKEEARIKAEEEKKKREEEARVKAEEEKKRKEEEARQKAEQEERKRAEEEAKKKAEEEQKKKEQEAARAKAQEEKKKKEEEARKKLEAARLKAEEEGKRKLEEEAAKKRLEEERKRKAREEELRTKAEEAKKNKEEAERKKAEEARKKEEEDRKKRELEEEMKRKKEERAKRAAEDNNMDRTVGDKIAEKKKGEPPAAKADKDKLVNKDRMAAAREAARVAKEQMKAEEEEPYPKADITSLADLDVRDRLDEADGLLLAGHAQAALDQFNSLLLRGNRRSPRALWGKARALDSLADQLRSNKHLEKAIESYQAVVELGTGAVPEKLYLMAGRRCVDRMAFRGWSSKAIPLLKAMIKANPDQPELLNLLGTQFLLLGQNGAAGEMFAAVLASQPEDPYASLHLGFILKNAGGGKQQDQKQLERGVELLAKGVAASGGEAEAKFYYHLGEGLRRLGRESEADEVYRSGAEEGKFLSFWQRSLYNVEGLKAQPVWSKSETGELAGLAALESNWRAIRAEADALLGTGGEGGFEPEAEGLRDTGEWGQFELFRQGRRTPGCARAPRTCALLERIPGARTNKRGQAKFSAMRAGTHVHAHSGPTNCRIRAHLGLRVPDGDGLRMRVADRNLTWKEGEVLVFDDSFDHEVWFDKVEEGRKSDDVRVVLIVDLWHPELDEQTKAGLSPI